MDEPGTKTADRSLDGFAPLRQPVFAVLWIATVLGNTGTFMRDVASSWLITGLSASPMAVAVIQAAGTLPIFLLSIPAGVLADIFDRRRLLVVIQVLLALVSGGLMLLVLTGLLDITSLIALTFLGGIGAALMAPVWQSIVPELVPRAELRSAVALNSLGVNIARSIGPALGGLLLVTLGAAFTYGADVLSYLLVIAALLWWPRAAAAQTILHEGFAGAFRAGLRYARASRELHRVLLRATVYFALASPVWALLPLIARTSLQGDAGFYGMLLGAVGLGAIAGAVLLPWLRTRLDADGLLLAATVATAIVMGGVALTHSRALALLLLAILGVAWIIALTTLSGTAQAILPDWVRARGLSIYIMVFNGALAGGSLFWGFVAQQLGVATTLLLAAAGSLVLAAALYRWRLPHGDADLVPANHWPAPAVVAGTGHGPVLVLIRYRVLADDQPRFLHLLARLAEERRRDGAHAWGMSRDAADSQRLCEWFFVESWAEHMRQHQRVSRADAQVQAEALELHTGPDPPLVEHLLAIEAPPFRA